MTEMEVVHTSSEKIQHYHYWTGLVILVLLPAATTAELSLLPADIERTLDNHAQTFLQCQEAASISMVIVNRSETLFAKGYGSLQVGGGSLVSADTMYNVASITKAMFSTVIGVVLDRNKNTLGHTFDTKVRDILGEDVIFPEPFLTSNVTLRDTLSHRTGIPNYLWAAFREGNTPQLTIELVRHMKNLKGIREYWLYNNVMYSVAARAMEKITGESWKQTMRTILFEPLNMTSSTFVSDVSDADPNLVSPALNDRMTGGIQSISWDVNRYWMRGTGPAGDVVSTANDMARYLRCVLNRGLGDDGTQVLPSSVLDEVYTPTNGAPPISQTMLTDAPIPKYFSIGYGLGINLGFYNGWRGMTHRGATCGQPSRMRAVQGVYVMTSAENGRVSNILAELAVDMMTGIMPPAPNASLSCAPRTLPNRTEAAPTRPLTAYEGRYGNFIYGNVSVNINNGTLMMRYGEIFMWRLLVVAPDTFDAEMSSMINSAFFFHPNIQFTVDGTKAKTLKIPTFDPVTDPVFERDLRMDQAPGPPEACPNVPPSSNTADPLFTNSFLLIGLFFLVTNI